MSKLDALTDVMEEKTNETTSELASFETGLFIAEIVNMIIKIISTCRGDANEIMNQSSRIRTAVAKRAVKKSLRKSKQKVDKKTFDALVQDALDSLDESHSHDLAEVVDEINSIDWGSL